MGMRKERQNVATQPTAELDLKKGSPVSLPTEAQGVASKRADLGLEELLDGAKLAEAPPFVAEEALFVHQQGVLEERNVEQWEERGVRRARMCAAQLLLLESIDDASLKNHTSNLRLSSFRACIMRARGASPGKNRNAAQGAERSLFSCASLKESYIRAVVLN